MARDIDNNMELFVRDSLGLSINDKLEDFDNNKSNYFKIDSSLAGKMDSVMQLVPVILNIKKSGDVYRVDIPTRRSRLSGDKETVCPMVENRNLC